MPQPLRWLGNRIKSGVTCKFFAKIQVHTYSYVEITHFSTCTCKMGILDTFFSVAPFSTSYHIISLREAKMERFQASSSLQKPLTRKAVNSFPGMGAYMRPIAQ